MDHRITTTYTRAIAVRGAALFWRRFIAKETVAGVAAAGLLAAWTLRGRGFPENSIDWVLLAVGGVGALVAVAGAVVYFVVRARSLDLFDRMGSPVVEWTFTDDGLRVRSELGEAVTKWRAVRKVWLFEDVWLIFFSKVSYSTLPIENVPPEARRLILDRVREAGGEIRPDPDAHVFDRVMST